MESADVAICEVKQEDTVNTLNAEDASAADGEKDYPKAEDNPQLSVPPSDLPLGNSSEVQVPHEPTDLTGKWEIAALTFYASCFERIWHLPQVFAEDIEDGCNALCEDMASQFFLDFFIALLQSFRKSVEVNRLNYEVYLSRIAAEAGKGDLLANFADQNFWVLPATTRLELLMALCLGRIDTDVHSLESKLKDVDSDSIRMEPLGEDSKGQIYWHFGDTRLYRDVPPPPPPPPKKKPAPAKSKGKRKFGSRSKRGKRKSAPAKADTSADASLLDSSMNLSGNEKEDTPQEKERWELVCSTEDQWHTFLAELATSNKKNDVELCNRINETILPILPEIFANKEKILKKRALMLAPRRQSYRLEEKRKAYVDASRFISFIANDGQIIDTGNGLEVPGSYAGSNDSTQDSLVYADGQRRRKFRRAPMTNEEALEQKRQMEEEMEKSRQKAASARADRALRRAEGVPATGLEDVEVSDMEQVEEDEEEDEAELDYYRMEDILTQLAGHQDAPPFAEPVPVSLAPDYYDVIKNPMDLSSMSEKLIQRQYKNIEQFIADFDLICQNCLIYNGSDNPYTVKARRFSRHFQSLLRRSFPQAAKERVAQGFFGQMQTRSAASRETEIIAVAHETSESSGGDDGVDDGAVWNIHGDDDDWSPSKKHSRSGEKKPRRKSTKKELFASPGGSLQGDYAQFCNNLDDLLDAEGEGAFVRAKSSPKRRRKTGDLVHEKPIRSRAVQPPPPQQVIIPNPAAASHTYTQQVRFASPPVQTAVKVLRQTPTGLQPVPYYRPTIGEPPPPIRRTTTVPALSSPTSQNPNGLRALLLNTPSNAPASNGNGNVPVVKIKLVAAAKPGSVQMPLQQPGAPRAYMMPIAVAQRPQGSQAVVVVPTSSGSQPISLARVAQVATVAQSQARLQPQSLHQSPPILPKKPVVVSSSSSITGPVYAASTPPTVTNGSQQQNVAQGQQQRQQVILLNSSRA